MVSFGTIHRRLLSISSEGTTDLAGGRKKSATDVTTMKEFDLGQVELRRQICP